MAAEIPTVKDTIQNMVDAAKSGQVDLSDVRYWSGNQLIIADPDKYDQKSLRPAAEFIVLTKHALEASWLMKEIWETYNAYFDTRSKFALFGRIGSLALTCLDKQGDTIEVLDAIASAAVEMIGQLRTGYFAYGSNMDADQMAERCPDAKMITPGTLNGYRLCADAAGGATIEPDADSQVEGIIWRVSVNDIARLDYYEGVASGCCQKQDLPVVGNLGGRTMTANALVYVSLR